MLKSFDPAGIRTIDVRELEMPLPMVNILEQLQSIAPGEALFVYHKKVPVFLLPELKERGFEFLIQDTADNKVNLLIFRP
jgi:TusA-related sulfurtransferase